MIRLFVALLLAAHLTAAATTISAAQEVAVATAIAAETSASTAESTNSPPSTVPPTSVPTMVSTEIPLPTTQLTPTPESIEPSPTATYEPESAETETPTEVSAARQSEFFAAATMGLTTSPSGTVTVGGTVTAQASGLVLGLGILGTLTYYWWEDGSCGGLGGAQHTIASVTVVLVIPSSGAVTMPSAGARSFSAHYGGDLTNPAQDSICVPITVTPRTTTVTVTPPAGTLTAGESKPATASLSGGYLATGTLIYSIYPNNTCTGTPTTTVTVPIVTPGTMPASGNMLLNRVGATGTDLYWLVTYSGDSNNNPDPSPCTAKTVAKATTTLSLALAPTPVTTGQPTVGTPPFTGSVLSAGGALTFTAYQNNLCTTLFSPSVISAKTVVAGVAPVSDGLLIPLVGIRYVQVIYAGDDNNLTSSSLCIPVTVTIASPTLALTVNPSQINVGGSATGVGSLSGGSIIATGTATYRVYSEGTCTTEVAGKSSTALVTAGVVSAITSPTSISFATAGQFYWKGVYGGDTNNNPASSPCVSFRVLATPSLSVAFSPGAISVGGSTVATSSLTGATGTAGGTVTYATYSDSGCSSSLASSINGAKTVSAAAVPNSDSAVFTNVGTYYVRATYGGDTLNNGAVSGCAALTVSKLSPSLTMSQAPSPVAIGGSFAYSFGLSGSSGGATGTVTLRLYTSDTCGTQLPGQTYSMNLSGGTVPGSPSINYVFPGTAYARSVYGGDANHNVASTSCQAVNLLIGPITASLSDATLDPLAYSNSSQLNSGVIVLTVTDSRGTAAGWSVTISAGPFVYSGSAIGQANIPAANFSLTGTSSPTTTSGQPIGTGGPVASASTGPLDTSRTVVVASPGFGSGTYSQVLDVELIVPGTSLAGTYTTTMTVTTSAAP